MTKNYQVRVPNKLIKKKGLQDAILEILTRIVSPDWHLDWSRKESYLLFINEIGTIRAFHFGRQWKTILAQHAKRERVRFYINLPTEMMKND